MIASKHMDYILWYQRISLHHLYAFHLIFEIEVFHLPLNIMLLFAVNQGIITFRKIVLWDEWNSFVPRTL